jgi:integrase
MTRVNIRKKPDRTFYQLVYTDKLTGQERTKSAKTADLKTARLEAARWQIELEANGYNGKAITWEAFRRRFQDEHLTHCEVRSRVPVNAAMNHFEKIVGKPRDIRQVKASTMSQFVAGLSKMVDSPSSVVTYTRHVLTALHWGQRMELLDRVPKVSLPRVVRASKGRSLTNEEFEKMLAAVDQMKCRYAAKLKRLMRGLFLSGLRAAEAIRLNWEKGSVLLDMDGGKYPRIIFSGKGQKSRRNEVMPITPDFADFLNETPKENRVGSVFGLPIYAAARIAEAGEKAKIVVNDQGKFASAHDLRRTFGTRWSYKVRPIILQRIMRHVDIKTTLRHYVDQAADDVGRELWETVQATVPPKEDSKAGARKKTLKKPR